MVGKSAGEFLYNKMAYADWVAYLWSWNMGILRKPSSQAIIALTCAEYILVPFYGDGCGEPPLMHSKLLASVIIGKI